MRMTNEEFQAEVFRRSAAYQQEHTKRIRIMTRAAAAFAGCLLLTVGAGIAFSRNGLQKADMTAESAAVESHTANGDAVYDNADAENAAEFVEESSEDSSAEKGKNTYGDTNTAGDAAPSLHIPGKSDTNSDADIISGADSAAEPGHGVFVSKTGTEILEHYGLDAMPETLGGLRMTEVANFSNYEDRKPGFIVSEDNAALILSDENTFCYSGTQDPTEQLYVCVYTAKGDAAPAVYSTSGDPADHEETAGMTVSGLGVRIKAYCMEHDALEQIVAELTAYLKEHKSNG